jgi:hypothetical protein
MLCLLGLITYLGDNQDIQIGYHIGYQSIRAFFTGYPKKLTSSLLITWLITANTPPKGPMVPTKGPTQKKESHYFMEGS